MRVRILADGPGRLRAGRPGHAGDQEREGARGQVAVAEQISVANDSEYCQPTFAHSAKMISDADACAFRLRQVR